MRLLVIQDYLRMGGTERQSLFILKCAIDAGHEARLLLFRPGGVLWPRVKELGIETDVLQSLDTRVCLLAPGLIEHIDHIHPDVILCMGRTANCYSGLIQRRFPSIPVVGTLRTGKFVFPLHHWSMGQVRAVLVNSNWWKRRMLERGFPDEKVHVVHNAMMLNVDLQDRVARRNHYRALHHVSDDTCLFLNVATFRPGKRHMEMLQIMAELPVSLRDRWRLWLVGGGREFKRCKRYVEEHGLERNIKFFGEASDPTPYYCAADAAVSVSREDSLPNFLIESQAMGLPLVAYDCRGVIECCEPGKTGIVLAPDQPEAFRDALIRMINEPDWRRALGSGGPSFASARFSPERQAELTLQFLDKLKQQRNGGTLVEASA